MKIICITGKAQHGKDTVGEMLMEELERAGFYVLKTHFAWLVKEVCKEYFGWDGEKDEAGRSLLQYVGTDKVRKKYPDFWCGFVSTMLDVFPNEWDFVIIPDVRFPNEFSCFMEKDLDVELIRVIRPYFDNGLTPEQKAHASETALDNYIADETIVNCRGLDELRIAVKNMAKRLIEESEMID